MSENFHNWVGYNHSTLARKENFPASHYGITSAKRNGSGLFASMIIFLIGIGKNHRQVISAIGNWDFLQKASTSLGNIVVSKRLIQ